MAEKIEGHVQYNGGIWQFYRTFQPNLRCEFDDHRTCISKSKELNDAMTQAEQDDLDAQVEQSKEEVAAAAAQAKIDADRADVIKAGQRKHEATRQNGLAKLAAENEAKAIACDALAKAKALYDASLHQIEGDLTLALKTATDKAIAAQKEIEGTDWLAQVKDENAEAAKAAQDKADADAKAKADAEAAAKAQAEADAKAKADAEAAAISQAPDHPVNPGE